MQPCCRSGTNCFVQPDWHPDLWMKRTAAQSFSKVSPDQFRLFMKRIGAPIERAPKKFRQLFSSEFIDDVFLAEECAFNSVSLKDAMIERARSAGVELRTGTEVSGHTHIKEAAALDLSRFGPREEM